MNKRQITYIVFFIFNLFMINSVFANTFNIKLLELHNTESDINRFGKLAVVDESSSLFKDMYFNNKHIVFPQNYFSIFSLLYKIRSPNYITYIIYAGTGGTLDNDTNKNCYFLNILSKNKYSLSNLTYCPILKDGVTVKDDKILVKYANVAPYSDPNDIGLLQYYKQKIKIIKPTFNDSFYNDKFADYTTEEVVEEAKKDGCFDSPSNLINISHVCHYGQKYCFKFKSINAPMHDKYYDILNKSCTESLE